MPLGVVTWHQLSFSRDQRPQMVIAVFGDAVCRQRIGQCKLCRVHDGLLADRRM